MLVSCVTSTNFFMQRVPGTPNLPGIAFVMICNCVVHNVTQNSFPVLGCFLRHWEFCLYGSDSSSAPSPVSLSRKAQSHQATRSQYCPNPAVPLTPCTTPSPYATATRHPFACCAKPAGKYTLFSFLLGNTVSFSVSVRDTYILKIRFPGELPITAGHCVIKVSSLII